jgi:hypothetical protein
MIPQCRVTSALAKARRTLRMHLETDTHQIFSVRSLCDRR